MGLDWSTSNTVSLNDDEGKFIDDPAIMKSMIYDFIVNLFSNDQSLCVASLPKNMFPKCGEREWVVINSSFTLKDIKKSLFEMESS